MQVKGRTRTGRRSLPDFFFDSRLNNSNPAFIVFGLNLEFLYMQLSPQIETESIFDETLLDRLEAGDKEALLELDKMGLLLGPGETTAAYSERLRGLQERMREMEKAFETKGEYNFEGLKLRAKDRISTSLLRESTVVTQKHYKFQIDWVPAFFINPSFSWLFGGCAYYFYPETFALMIIRSCFADQRKWFIYDRNEILAHEMCHVARLPFFSTAYEERFAYRISESRFRCRFGGVFESPRDSFMLLGSTLLLLAAQVGQTMFRPELAIWPFWSLVGGVAAFLLGRDGKRQKSFRQAEKNLQTVTANNGNHAPVLFRCTDEEIRETAQLKQSDKLRDWIRQKSEEELRWKVIVRRFLSEL